jgi:hypothetical protein
LRPSLFKIGIGLTILGMVWLSFVFNEGDRISENFSLKSSDSAEIELYFEGEDIGYYKIFMPEFTGKGVFVQILDMNHNVISDGIVETKMAVGYFDFEQEGAYVAKITNLSDDQMNLEVGGLMIVISLYFKLRDYRIEQPDENIS